MTKNSVHIAHKWQLWHCVRLENCYSHLGHPFQKMAPGINIALSGHLAPDALSQMQNLMLSEVPMKLQGSFQPFLPGGTLNELDGI